MISHTFVAFLGLLAILPAAFIIARGRPPHKAVLVTMIVVMLFAPEVASIDPPLLPTLGKRRLTSLGVLLVALVKWRPYIRRAGWFTPWELLIALGFWGDIMTAFTNPDPVTGGSSWNPVWFPGLIFRDGLNEALGNFLTYSLTFTLGRWFIRTPRHLEYALWILVINALVQSVFGVIEMWLSPQWHRWIWGYGVGVFSQSIRWGGYRPNVFTSHGLTFAFYMLWSWTASLNLLRAQPELLLTRFRFGIRRVSWYLGVMLVLCKSSGVLFYGAIAGFLIRFGRARTMMRLALALSLATLTYPMLRSYDLVPVADIITYIEENISEERAQSLEFRFVNEAGLMRRAQQRIWFGWGTFGRNFVFGGVGEPSFVIADGEWVLLVGGRGLVGFAHAFGLMGLPIIALFFHYRKVLDPALQRMLTGFALVVAVQFFDLVPNSSANVLPTLFAGALAGMLSEIRRPGSEWRARPAG